MGHNGSQYKYVIHVALIARDCASLITSFQPPLGPLLSNAKAGESIQPENRQLASLLLVLLSLLPHGYLDVAPPLDPTLSCLE